MFGKPTVARDVTVEEYKKLAKEAGWDDDKIELQVKLSNLLGTTFKVGKEMIRVLPDHNPKYTTHPKTESAQASITCHGCGHTSYNPHDVENKYCGYCKVFHDDRRRAK